MLAGRPHEAVSNGSPRWMAVGPRERVHRTRPTGRLARRLTRANDVLSVLALGCSLPDELTWRVSTFFRVSGRRSGHRRCAEFRRLRRAMTPGTGCRG